MGCTQYSFHKPLLSQQNCQKRLECDASTWADDVWTRRMTCSRLPALSVREAVPGALPAQLERKPLTEPCRGRQPAGGPCEGSSVPRGEGLPGHQQQQRRQVDGDDREHRGDGRDYRIGYGLGVLDRESLSFDLGVDAQRRESPMLARADMGFLGRAALGW